MIRLQDDGVLIDVQVSPRSSRTEILGLVDGTLRVRLTAAPVENAANAALVKVLSDFFNLPKSSVSIVVGTTSRRKQVLLRGVSKQDVEQRLNSTSESR